MIDLGEREEQRNSHFETLCCRSKTVAQIMSLRVLLFLWAFRGVIYMITVNWTWLDKSLLLNRVSGNTEKKIHKRNLRSFKIHCALGFLPGYDFNNQL